MKIYATCDLCGKTKHQCCRFRRINARTNEYSKVCLTCEREAKGSARLEKLQTKLTQFKSPWDVLL